MRAAARSADGLNLTLMRQVLLPKSFWAVLQEHQRSAGHAASVRPSRWDFASSGLQNAFHMAACLTPQVNLQACLLLYHPSALPPPKHVLSLAITLHKFALHHVRSCVTTSTSHHTLFAAVGVSAQHLELQHQGTDIACVQTDDAMLLDEAMLMLAALAMKEAQLPSGMVPYLAQRFLPSYCVSIAIRGDDEPRNATTFLASSVAPSM